MNLGHFFQPTRRGQKPEGGGASSSGRASGHSPRRTRGRRGPRLDRCNAKKDIDYCAADVEGSSLAAADGRGGDGGLTHSLEVFLATGMLPAHFAGKTSFRITGEVEGEFDALCRILGLSGPEDFGISRDDWAIFESPGSQDLSANVGASDLEARSRPHPEEPLLPPPLQEAPVTVDCSKTTGMFHFDVAPATKSSLVPKSLGVGSGREGIKGARPAMLAPPPRVSLPFPLGNNGTPKSNILRSPVPGEGHGSGHAREISSHSEEEQPEEQISEELLGENVELEQDGGIRTGETSMDLNASCSFWTSNDDDSSSTTTEGTCVISPVGKLRRNIVSWTKGHLLGSGSFGTVYEAMSDDGFFFAIKEVSLVHGVLNAQQCINQLEQEIALLSQFEHENIVQYFGTAKEESRLCIFLELVSQGSLASLYQKYHLRESHVSIYTRQILNGLGYLHDRNVVHRDIKCANILVDANGSVKLADFGLAKEITKFNDVKSCKGSVYWMAPEVVKAKRSYGHSADIWSLGCTVLEMLTQQHPFPNLEWNQAIFHIGRGARPPIPKSVSQDARDFVEQCCQVDPERRPPASKLLDHPFVKRLLPSPTSESPM